MTLKLSKYQCLSKLSRSFASYESSKPYESILNNISDMKNSEATKQPMIPDTSTCGADHNDELSKDSVIDYHIRKLMRYPYQSPVIEQGLSSFVNANMPPGTGTENLPEFRTRKRRACFMKTG